VATKKNKPAIVSPQTPRAYSAAQKAANSFYKKKGGKVVVAGNEKHIVYKKDNKIGKGEPGDIMVNHPTKDKGKWDTINLTKKAKAKTVKQGIAATKKWHKDNPDYKYKGKKK